MAVLGNNVIMVSTFTLNRGGVPVGQWGSRYTAASSGSVYQISTYLAGQAGTNANLTQDIYADDGSTLQPGVLLASSADVLITTNQAASWVTAAISLNITAGTIYWLCPRLENAGASGVTINADTLSGSRDGSFTQQSNPAAGWSLISDNHGESIYADYTTGTTGSVDWLAF